MLQSILGNDGFGLWRFVPLLGVLALFAGGAMVMVSANARVRAETLSRRVGMVQTGRKSSVGGAREGPEVSGRNAASYGVTEAEHRQIMRMFAGSNAGDGALVYFTVARGVLALAGGTIVMLTLSMSSIWLTILFAVAATAFGWQFPLMVARWKLKNHGKSVSSGLPGGLELLAICVEAGLSLENGLQRVARELRGAQPALADELALTWAEISILPSRDQALANLADRVNLPSVRSVVGTLAQSMRYGSPLAQSLRNAAEEMRNEQLMQLEERANRLPALMTVPVMLLIMPTVFLIVGGPAVLRLIDIFSGGK